MPCSRVHTRRMPWSSRVIVIIYKLTQLSTAIPTYIYVYFGKRMILNRTELIVHNARELWINRKHHRSLIDWSWCRGEGNFEKENWIDLKIPIANRISIECTYASLVSLHTSCCCSVFLIQGITVLGWGGYCHNRIHLTIAKTVEAEDWLNAVWIGIKRERDKSISRRVGAYERDRLTCLPTWSRVSPHLRTARSQAHLSWRIKKKRTILLALLS